MAPYRETDLLVRLIRRYNRISRHDLIVEAFLKLDELLCNGEPIPEEWDKVLSFRAKARFDSGDYYYEYPPGLVVAACSEVSRPCRWVRLATEDGIDVCLRCHTIRRRIKLAVNESDGPTERKAGAKTRVSAGSAQSRGSTEKGQE